MRSALALRALVRPSLCGLSGSSPTPSVVSCINLSSSPSPSPSSSASASASASPSSVLRHRSFSQSTSVGESAADSRAAAAATEAQGGQRGGQEGKRDQRLKRQARKGAEEEKRQSQLQEREDVRSAGGQSMSKVDGQVDADADAAGRASEGGGGGASVKSKSNIVSPLDLSTSNFPSLLYAAHPLLDSGHTTSYKADERYFAADHHLTHFSSRGVIPASPPSAEFSARVGLGPIASASAGSAEAPDSRGNRAAQQLLAKVTPLSVEEIAGLFRHVLAIDRVVRQTGKGKIPKMRALVLAGNGRGLIGVGTAKDEIANMAVDKAFKNAVTNMDYIDRFEGRTVHATMEAKWGATRVTLRPRPPGFGLRVPPAVHAFARCVGISDLSASIEGSTNRHATVYALLNVLAGGPGNPIGMGDGLGGPARRMDKGVGMKPVKTLEWERGRRFKSVLQ